MYASGVNAKLLEVTDKQLGDINHIANSWFRFEIPANTYPRQAEKVNTIAQPNICLLYTSPSPRDRQKSRMPSSA